jgi:hypothetical protein
VQPYALPRSVNDIRFRIGNGLTNDQEPESP